MIKKLLLCGTGSIYLTAGFAFSQETLREEFPLFDPLRATFTQTGAMDFDSGPGDLSVRSYEIRAILSRPIELFQGINMIPFFNYELTQLNFSGTGAIPISDEDLHSASLQALFFKNFNDTPWIAVGWTRAEMATDYQGIGGDDFTFDVALGVAYKVNDAFTLGTGFVVTDLNGRERFFPGINLDWNPTEEFRMGIYGPNLFARYIVDENWFVSIDGSPNGGVWNIDDNSGISRDVNLDSYIVGLYTHHKISQKFWVSIGAGYTFGNEIEIRNNGRAFTREMDGAPFVQLALSLREW